MLVVDCYTVTMDQSDSSIRWLLSVRIGQAHFVMYTSYHAALCDVNQLCIRPSLLFNCVLVCMCACVRVCVWCKFVV